ncbi:MAG: sucrase ferredoxin [Acidimicrobiales bacterium]
MCPVSPRCSVLSRSEGVDPVATAGVYDGFLLVEWPLPWPADMGEAGGLAGLGPALSAARVRLQGLVTPERDRPELRRLILYRRRPGEWFRGYERVERLVPQAGLVPAAQALLALAPGDGPRPNPREAGDVLVCTHGNRDVCCGSAGTELVGELAPQWDTAWGYRLWRTSHTGGHRFAPTAFVFPQGTAWAYLDAPALIRILNRQGPLDDLLPRFRGCSGLATRAAQALDRAVLGQVGWPYLDYERRGWDMGEGRTRLEVRSPEGQVQAWEATVRAGRVLPVPVCRRPLTEATKAEAELVLSDLTRI